MSTTADSGAAAGGALGRLARACALHPWRTIGTWIVLIIAIATSARAPLANARQRVHGSGSGPAGHRPSRGRFPERAGDSAQIVFKTEAPADRPGSGRRTDCRPGRPRGPRCDRGRRPLRGRGRRVSRTATSASSTCSSTPRPPRSTRYIQQLEDDVRAAIGDDAAVQVEFGGPVMDGVQARAHQRDPRPGRCDGRAAHRAGLGRRDGDPDHDRADLGGLGLSLLTIAAAFTDFNAVTPILAVMIGLGVGIDYALFIVTRFRQALAEASHPRTRRRHRDHDRGTRRDLRRPDRRGVHLGSRRRRHPVRDQARARCRDDRRRRRASPPSPCCRPILAAGRPPDRLGRRCRGRNSRGGATRPGTPLFGRWGRLVTRHPKTWSPRRSPRLRRMAAPVLGQRLGTADAGTDPADTTTRKAYDLIAEGFGPGLNGPLLVAVDQAGDPAADLAAGPRSARTQGVAQSCRRWSTRPVTPRRSRSS